MVINFGYGFVTRQSYLKSLFYMGLEKQEKRSNFRIVYLLTWPGFEPATSKMQV